MLPAGLSTFYAVVLAKSIRKASAQLGVEPSSVSRQIAILERQIGTALLERTSKGVVLTHAGSLVADYAKTVLLDFEALRADLDDQRGSSRRLIRIVTVESIVSGGPLDAVTRFRKRFDGVAFKLTVVPATAVLDAVVRGECDIGIAFCAQPHPDVEVLASVVEPIALVVPRDHPLTRKVAVTLGDLQSYALGIPDVNFGVRRLFDQACDNAGVTVIPALTSNDFEALRDFVLCGGGLAILPGRAIGRGLSNGLLQSVPISVKSLSETTLDILVRKRRIARIVRLFADLLTQSIT